MRLGNEGRAERSGHGGAEDRVEPGLQLDIGRYGFMASWGVGNGDDYSGAPAAGPSIMEHGVAGLDSLPAPNLNPPLPTSNQPLGPTDFLIGNPEHAVEPTRDTTISNIQNAPSHGDSLYDPILSWDPTGNVNVNTIGNQEWFDVESLEQLLAMDAFGDFSFLDHIDQGQQAGLDPTLGQPSQHAQHSLFALPDIPRSPAESMVEGEGQHASMNNARSLLVDEPQHPQRRKQSERGDGRHPLLSGTAAGDITSALTTSPKSGGAGFRIPYFRFL